MCGAYGFSAKDAVSVYKRFDVVNTLIDFKPRYNVRPGQLNPVITAHSPKQISRMFWGLINEKTEKATKRLSTINATAERIASSWIYKEAFKNRRCLIPATGFYEPDKEHNAKPPYPWYYFHLKDQEIFSFAGIYDEYIDPTMDKKIISYSLITTQPNEVVGKVHHRMPVIFQNTYDEDFWIDVDNNGDVDRLQRLLIPYPAAKMEGWHVGDAARNARNDYPELVRPYSETEQREIAL